MFHLTQHYQNLTTNFPTHDVSLAEKLTPEYHVGWAEAIYSAWCRGNTLTSLSFSQRVERNRKIMRGEQDVLPYMGYFFGDVDIDNTIEEDFVRKALMNIDWTPVAAAVKFVNVIINMFEDAVIDMLFVAIDDESTARKIRKKAEYQVKMQYRDMFTSLNEMAGMEVVPMGDDIPKSERHLNFMEQFGLLRLAEEMAYEAASQEINDRCNVKEIMRDVIIDFICGAAAVIREYWDPVEKKLKKEHCDITRSIISYSNKEYTNPEYGGYIKFYTIAELKNITGWSDERLKEIAQGYVGYSTNPAEFNETDDYWGGGSGGSAKGTTPPWYATRISVLEYEFVGNNSSFYTTKKDPSGQDRVFEEKWNGASKPKIHNTPSKKTDVIKGNIRYTGSWVIGTKEVFSHGYQSFVPRKTLAECGSSFHHYKLKVDKPIIEIMLPHIDGMTMAILDLRNLQAKAPGPGFFIDVDATEDIQIGPHTLTPYDIIRVGARGGAMFYRGTTNGQYYEYNAASRTRPVEFFPGGFGPKLKELIELFEFHRRQIQELIGLPDIAVAGVSKRDTTLGEQQITFAASSNAIKHFLSGFVELEKQSAIHIINRIKLIAKYSKEGYTVVQKSIGFRNAETFRLGADAASMEIGVEVQPIMSQARKERILELAIQSKAYADQGGLGITHLDLMKIMHYLDAGKLREAEFYLAYRNEEEKAFRMEMQRINIEENMKKQQEAAMQNKQADMERDVLQNELKKDQASHQNQLDQEAAVTNNLSQAMTTGMEQPQSE